MNIRLFMACLLSTVVATLSFGVMAEQFPTRAIRLVVGFPPGGGADFVARLTAQKLSEGLGQTVVVDNRPGANGIIGTEFVAKSAPDGYTLLLGTSNTQAINPSMYASLPYDPIKDFEPVTEVALTSLILVVPPSLPVKNVQELISLAKSKPGELSYASAGVGNVAHLAAELFKSSTGINIVHVPYKGSSAAVVDVMSGRVSMYFDTMPSSLPHVRAGKLKGLAVTSAKRSLAAPDIPTVAESGVAGFETTSWFGILAPAGTPANIVNALRRETVKAMSSPDIIDKMKAQGLDPVLGTPEEFAAVINADIRKWRKVVRDANIKPE